MVGLVINNKQVNSKTLEVLEKKSTAECSFAMENKDRPPWPGAASGELSEDSASNARRQAKGLPGGRNR